MLQMKKNVQFLVKCSGNCQDAVTMACSASQSLFTRKHNCQLLIGLQRTGLLVAEWCAPKRKQRLTIATWTQYFSEHIPQTMRQSYLLAINYKFISNQAGLGVPHSCLASQQIGVKDLFVFTSYRHLSTNWCATAGSCWFMFACELICTRLRGNKLLWQSVASSRNLSITKLAAIGQSLCGSNRSGRASHHRDSSSNCNHTNSCVHPG